ncbi:3-hydroxyacyl-CoA dehydrogenase NAD-binding domain-containing protein [Candidatus Berkiella aquae]|uniref:Putative 3-hydroxyacyl-CoA dehydrogenase n=1 Tax=Candidatus Berkiella aquae TaxID=295108 RepID=A0A0Q9Z0M9_9GAMM|nr:3-hydroxyacyl-CoA dehydrogenase/enoyl-CoA hydratase family protein [Candidatus Berkiella aquae]
MVNESRLIIRKAAVLGAGVMGAQIAAHLTSAGIPTILYDLPAQSGNKNAIINSALQSLTKLKPDPLATSGMQALITPANYDSDLALLGSCDLVIEAIAERLDYKQRLYQTISPHLAKNAIFASNTSGLSIQELAEQLPHELKPRFCGIHFFNPPRYMKLVELIPHEKTDETLLSELETFLVTYLGKGVVYAKDTPNFIANRIGVFGMLAALHHSRELKLSPDKVDGLTGPLIGRPKSATFRTMDVVGLDTMNHVVQTLKQHLTDDPWNHLFQLPDWILQLIERGALGQKAQAGIYKKEKTGIVVYDFHEGNYRAADSTIDPQILAILTLKNPVERFAALHKSEHPQAQFIWRIFRDHFHYSAYHLEAIAQTTRDLDLCMRWGYGWQQGLFETWQSGDWHKIAKLISQDITAGKALSKQPLPAWATELDFNGAYLQGKAYAPAKDVYLPREGLPVYQRQLFPELVLTETADEGKTVFETDAIRMWTQNDNIAIVSFKTKKHTICVDVLAGIQEAIARAEKDFDALVLWQRDGADFSFGANLKIVNEALQTKSSDKVEKTVTAFHETALKLRYAAIPTVAAIRGMTLGGACELSMHTSKIVAAFETYIGLVEVGVGILPAGGGTKELAMRAAKCTLPGGHFNQLKVYFEQIAMAKVSTSGLDAKKLNYLQTTDNVVMNNEELLFVAKKQAQALADSGYHAPLPYLFPVLGKPGIANLMTWLINMREGEFISEHDFLIGSKIAEVICGGKVDAFSMVDEKWLLRLELNAIMELAQTAKTIDRIKYMLENGKPLRN